MKKVCCIALLCITFVMVSFYFENYYHPSYELNDFSDASEEEREAIALFYADDSSLISEGKYVDIKYAYFNPANMSDIRFEMIKKNTADVTFDSIIIKDKTGTKETEGSITGGRPYRFEQGSFGLVMGLANDDSFQYYGYCSGNALFLDSYLIRELTQDYIERNYSRITIAFKINGEDEVHELQYDKEKRFRYTMECKEKFLAGEQNPYYGTQTSYYYSTLFYRDFEKWKMEIEQLLASGIFRGLDKQIILNIPSCEDRTKSQEENMLRFRESLGLSNEEFAEYLTIVKRFIDLGCYVPDYIEEAALAE